MRELNKAARQCLFGAGLTIAAYILVLLFSPDPHFHTDEGVEVMGHDDHIHVMYRAVFELDPVSIESITAYFPEQETLVRIEGDRAISGQMSSGCGEVREWATTYPDQYKEWQLAEREARELRNLYSKITPDFRITAPPEGETYDLPDPPGCILIETASERVFLQFGRESAQGYSRYMRVNEGEQVYLVSRYFYTTISEIADGE